MKVLAINLEPVERVGKNWVGNIYQYRWVVYIEDDRKTETGMHLRIKGKDIPTKIAYIDTKPNVKKWLKDNKIEWDWENENDRIFNSEL